MSGAQARAVQQAGQLVRLRRVRMESASRALAAAREASAAAADERARADQAAAAAETAHDAARHGLAADPNEAERLLAVLDHAMFRRSLAGGALDEAKAAEQACVDAETARRKAMIVARARHDHLADHAAQLRRTLRAREDERAAEDLDHGRRQP